MPAISLMLLCMEQLALAHSPALSKQVPGPTGAASHMEAVLASPEAEPGVAITELAQTVVTEAEAVQSQPTGPANEQPAEGLQAGDGDPDDTAQSGDAEQQEAAGGEISGGGVDAEEGNRAGSVNPLLKQADALVREEKFSEALPLLRQLTKAEPDNLNAFTLLGFSAARLSQLPETSGGDQRRLLDEAIGAYHRILVDQPEQLHARLELATMFFLKRQDGLARKHFQRALVASPSRVLSAQIISFLRVIEERKRWQLSYGVALAPDTNLNSSSSEETVNVRLFGALIPFKRDKEALPKSGVGLSTWGGAEYQHPLSPRWRLRSSASVAIREYEDNDFDQGSLFVRVGPRWLVGTGDMSLLAAGRAQWQGGEHLLNAYGVEFEAGQRLSLRLRAYVNASWYQNEYFDRPWLTGPDYDYRLGLNLLVSPRLLLTFASGVSWSVPESIGHRHYSPWSRVGANVALPRGFTVGTSAEVRWADYERSWDIYNEPGVEREDRTATLRVSVHNRRLTVFGFSPQIVVTHTSRVSNAQAFDYVRTRSELLFVRQF